MFYLFALSGNPHTMIGTSQYFPRIGTDLYLLAFCKGRQIDNRNRTVYSYPSPVQSTGIGNVKFTILHTQILRITTHFRDAVYLQRSRIDTGYCSIVRTDIGLSFLKSNSTRLTGTTIIGQHRNLFDGKPCLKVYYLYRTRNIHNYIQLTAVNIHVIGRISQPAMIQRTEIIVRTSPRLKRIPCQRTVVQVKQSLVQYIHFRRSVILDYPVRLTCHIRFIFQIVATGKQESHRTYYKYQLLHAHQYLTPTVIRKDRPGIGKFFTIS